VTGGLVLGLDVGGSRLAGGLVEPSGEVLHAISVPTARRGPGRVLDNLLDVVQSLRCEADGRGRSVVGVGVGVPGVVDEVSGSIGPDIQNLPELRHIPLGRILAEQTGLRIAIDNDVNALLLGEWTFGQARGLRHVAMLAVGTGVGGALILNGELVRGASGYGGEVGHLCVELEGEACFCGSQGCVKTYAAGPDLARRARILFAHTPTPILGMLCGGASERIDAACVLTAAAQGDPVALAVTAKAAQALGAAVAALINLCNPELILLGGGVLEVGEILMRPIRRWAGFYAFGAAARATRIVRSAFTKESGVQGAAALFLTRASRPGAASWARAVPASR